MGALSDVIQDQSKRRAIVDDGIKAIEAEVSSKRGLSGLAVKAGFKVVRGIKPGFIGMALDHLLDDFSARIDPYYDQWRAGGSKDLLRSYFVANDAAIADSLLGVTDVRAQKAKNKVVKKAYEKLRPQGVQHVKAAMPRVGDLVAKHVD
jgi:hypothetical protein